MSGISSLYTAAGGLNAAQAGLYVTGHNISNLETDGYARQRIMQADSISHTLDYSTNGGMQVGLGTVITNLRHLRNKFLDESFRSENTKLGFYEIKAATGAEVESIMGEMQSRYNFQSVILDMWNSLQELSAHPEGVETRGSFIAAAGAFLTKADDVFERLLRYQHNLDGQIRDAVSRSNELLERVRDLNEKIASEEIGGDHANDYRDERNVCLDKLSLILPIYTKEKSDGSVVVIAEGHVLLSDNVPRKLGLKYFSGDYSFVEPILTDSDDILPADTPIDSFTPLFKFISEVNAQNANDNGSLKGMMTARGLRPINYLGENAFTAPNPLDIVLYPLGVTDTQYLIDVRNYENNVYSARYCFIPQVMRQADLLIHETVTLINDTFAPYAPSGAGYVQDPNGPYDLTNTQSFTEVFSRKYIDRWDSFGALFEELDGDYYSQYTSGNLRINPALLNEGGMNLLAVSPSGDREDNRLLRDLLRRWNEEFIDFGSGEKMSVNDAYKLFISYIGTETKFFNHFTEKQRVLSRQIDDKRSQFMGVSLDEELKNMMLYQHAYDAAARILNVVDSMLDKLVNGTGRVGL